MPTESTRCQFIDKITRIECDNWYPFEEGQSFCPLHRLQEPKREVPIQHRTVTTINGDHLASLNQKISECLQMSIPEIADHIRAIELRIQELERDRRAANIAKRNLEDRLTEEERAALRESDKDKSYRKAPAQKPKKTPEEKAKTKKEGFSAWAARLGVKVDDLMIMDDDEMASRIAKYKAARS